MENETTATHTLRAREKEWNTGKKELLYKFTLQQAGAKSVRHTLDNSIWISVYFILLSQRIHKIYINFEYVSLSFFCFIRRFFLFFYFVCFSVAATLCLCCMFFFFARALSVRADKISEHIHRQNEKKINANHVVLFVFTTPIWMNALLFFSLSIRCHDAYIRLCCLFAGRLFLLSRKKTSINSSTHLIRLEFYGSSTVYSSFSLFQRTAFGIRASVFAARLCLWVRHSYVCVYVCMWMLLYGRYRGWV